MIFKTPIILICIPFVIAGLWILHRRRKLAALRFSSLRLLPLGVVSWRQRLADLPFGLQLIALGCLLTALAGPRLVSDIHEVTSEGIDIILAIDVSGSMAAEDFEMQGKRQNRLDVAKAAVKDFIASRKNDRIALVAFARQAYVISPLTTDQQWLLSSLDRLRLGLIEDGTAIGSGLSSALVRLRKSEAKSKVIILLTDGINNAGDVSPLEAAGIAKSMGVKIYTIGAGSRGAVPFPVEDAWGRKRYQRVRIEIDESMLQKVAQETGGRYFRADDTKALTEIYQTIDRMETTRVTHYGYREYRELFGPVVVAGLVLLALSLILENTILRVLP